MDTLKLSNEEVRLRAHCISQAHDYYTNAGIGPYYDKHMFRLAEQLYKYLVDGDLPPG